MVYLNLQSRLKVRYPRFETEDFLFLRGNLPEHFYVLGTDTAYRLAFSSHSPPHEAT